MANKFEVIETNVGIVRVAKGTNLGDTFVLASLMENGKVKTSTYEGKNGTVEVVNFNSQEGAFSSFRLETFKTLDVKVVDGWACVVATIVERPEVDEVNKAKAVKGSTLI